MDTIEKIMASSNLTREDVEKKIEEKRAELSGLISKEGATYIVAKEMGLDIFQKPKRELKINSIEAGMKNLTIAARIAKISDAREFDKDGKKGRVVNLTLKDGNDNIRLSLWDDQIELIKDIKEGEAIEISNAYARAGFGGNELRLGQVGKIKLIESSSLPAIDNSVKRGCIASLKEGMSYEIRAAVVQLFESEPFYEICPECGSRAKRGAAGFACAKHGVVVPKFAMIISGVIDDGTGNIRAAFFRNVAEKLVGMPTEKAIEKGSAIFEEADLLGKEFIFSGYIRKNKMFERLEFIASDVRDVDAKSEANMIINAFASK